MRFTGLLCTLLALSACRSSATVGEGTLPSPTGAGTGVSIGAPIEHLIVVSVDGLPPSTYLSPDADKLQIPAIRLMARDGAISEGLTPVFPTVTYPNHTTMLTGHVPSAHGIFTNKPPMEDNRDGWRWYSEDIRVQTVWQAVSDKGGTTAMVNWPVTVGADVDWLIPEYWRAGTSEDLKLVRALSTPGLLDEVAAKTPDLWTRYDPKEMQDQVVVDMATHILEDKKPTLTMIHLWGVDTAQHQFGPGSAEALAAIEETDRQIRRLIEAAKRAGIWENSALMIVSDHGFHAIENELRPNVALKALGLRDPGKPRVTLSANGGMTYVYTVDSADKEAGEMALKYFQEKAREPDSPLLEVLSPAEIRQRGGDPGAAFALLAREGSMFSASEEEGFLVPASRKGHHGFDPGDPAMTASFLVYGPKIHSQRLEGGDMTMVAPTIARLLGVPLPDTKAKPFAITILRDESVTNP